MPLPPVRALIVGLLPFVTGCIVHEARVLGPEAHTARSGALAGSTVVHPFKGKVSRESPFAAEMPTTIWIRQPDGTILRADTEPRTPLPWWQRFPADIGTDLLWPWEIRVVDVHRVSPAPIAGWDPDALTARARAFGYATGRRTGSAEREGDRP